VMGKPPGAATDKDGLASSRVMLLMLVLMTGVAPISLYMLVPALPVLATNFGRDISIAQMTVSLYMVGIACSQIIMGPLSDKFGRRPVLLAGLGLMVAASIGCSFAETLPQLIAARFFQALGGASGMVISRAIIRDLYSRDRVGAMISLVIAVMMIAQMLSPLTGGVLETAFGWRGIFYLLTAAALANLVGHLFCVRFAPGPSLEKLIWFGLALQLGGSLLNLIWSFAGINQAPAWLFGTQMIVMAANAFVMANASAGAISVRP